jgi:DNA-binding XRE family transcriptional regulator
MPPVQPKEPFHEALRWLRIGSHAEAKAAVIREAAHLTMTPDLELARRTILAEIADHDGEYDEAAALVEDDAFIWITKALEDDQYRDQRKFRYRGKTAAWRRLRQQLFYQWQRSVVAYRAGSFPASRKLMRTALTIAKKLEPRAEGLLTQLYYGTGKMEFQRGNHAEATSMYREAIVNAAAGPANAKADDEPPEEIQHAEAVARYFIAKALSLGLGPCMREKGYLDQAYPFVVAGLMLLEDSGDRALIFHAQQTLASIERGTAGERERQLLKTARKRLEECVDFFSDFRREEWFRSHYELALVYMQQGLLPKARAAMLEVRKHAVAPMRRPKWVANASIGLSRIERRARNFDAAIEAAQTALNEAGPDQKKIERRARGSLARALAEAAVGRPTQEDLEEALKELDVCLDELDKDRDDVRNRLTLDLWKALVLHKLKNSAGAEAALREYERDAARVDIGRIKEFAKKVTRQVRGAAAGKLGLPIENDDYRLVVNREAIELLAFQKVQKYQHKARRAKELDVSRQTYYELEKKYLPDDSPSS